MLVSIYYLYVAIRNGVGFFRNLLHGLSGFVVSDKYYVSEAVGFVGKGGNGVVERAHRRPQAHGHVHVFCVGGSVNGKCDVILVECIVTVIPQQLGDSHAFLVERCAVKQVARLCEEGAVAVCHNQAVDGAVRDIVVKSRYEMRLTGDDIIYHVNLLIASHKGVDCDFAIHITLVDECLMELECRCEGELRVVDDRRLPELSRPSVKPLGCIFSRHIVGCQLQFQEAEHFMVGGLTQIIPKL